MTDSLKKVLRRVSLPFHSHSKHKSEAKANGNANPKGGDGDGAGGGEKGLSASGSGSHTNSNSKDASARESTDSRNKARQGDAEDDAREERIRKLKEAWEHDPVKDNYGTLPHTGEDVKDERKRETFGSIDESRIGETVVFRARIHNIRPISAKLVFITFRQQSSTLQGVLTCDYDVDQGGESNPPPVSVSVSENMVRWAEHLYRETIVLVEGEIKKPPEEQGGEVKSTSNHGVEVSVKKLHVISEVTTSMPFSVENASLSVEETEKDDARARIGGKTRLDNRLLDLRTATKQAIFRVQSAICQSAREYLSSQGFLEIHSAKFQGAATESGASVFRVDYFKRSAFLAQSPQLAKEMCIAADFERVYEIGPVYRAENSNTHRHMTEFTGLDLEMTIERTYHESLDIIDNMLLHIFRSLQKNHSRDIEMVKLQHPHDDFVFLEKTLRLKFRDGIELLKADGWKEEADDGGEEELSEYDDLSTAAEQRLGQIIKEKYNTDYYILDKFPLEVRPFYTMPDPENPKLSNSFDIFVRGEEILSGGQRLHSAVEMEKRMKEAGIDPKSMTEYLDGFRWGMPPHAGGGIGLERLVMLFLRLGDIRNASLFPRDPKSFRDSPPFNEKPRMSGTPLKPLKGGIPGFEEPNSISHDPLKKDSHPPLEDLIAEFGDSTNTAWTDEAYEIYRHESTGAAVGFIPSSGHAIIWGYPLCQPELIPEVTTAFVDWLAKDRKLKPLWLNADDRTEKVLAGKLGWRALSVAADQRFDPEEVDAEDDKNRRQKVHQAEREGVKFSMVEENFPRELKDEIDRKLRDWQANRKGTQVHTTSLRPWADSGHRTYFVAKDKQGGVCGLVVLAKLSQDHGYQIKWSLAFPDCPKGTSEYITYKAIEAMAKAGVNQATFGVGAAESLDAVDNVGALTAKALSKVYGGITQTFGLTRKSGFRRKFGATEEAIYVCYPPHGMSLGAIEAIMASVKDKKKKKT